MRGDWSMMMRNADADLAGWKRYRTVKREEKGAPMCPATTREKETLICSHVPPEFQRLTFHPAPFSRSKIKTKETLWLKIVIIKCHVSRKRKPVAPPVERGTNRKTREKTKEKEKRLQSGYGKHKSSPNQSIPSLPL